ncbi:MAG: alpha/beta hydrolase [Elusimicrobiota bacterium]|nr:alpha/beta hydrolase [Elusimicrobiota bacterium]
MKRFFIFLTAFVFCALCARAAEEIEINTEDEWIISGSYEPAAPAENAENTENIQPAKYLLLLHDLGKDKTEFSKLGNKLKNAGFGFLAVDLRGHGKSINKGEQKQFIKTGVNNEFNQMVRDVTAAVYYLNGKGIATENIYLVGSGLGANIAAKSLIFTPDIAGIALLTPSLKMRGVLTISGIRMNKKPVFIAVSSEDRKQMVEASIIHKAAFLSCGEGKVTFMTAYDLKGAEMINKYLTDEFLQWLKQPQLPEIIADIPEEENINVLIQDATGLQPSAETSLR